MMIMNNIGNEIIMNNEIMKMKWKDVSNEIIINNNEKNSKREIMKMK